MFLFGVFSFNCMVLYTFSQQATGRRRRKKASALKCSKWANAILTLSQPSPFWFCWQFWFLSRCWSSMLWLVILPSAEVSVHIFIYSWIETSKRLKRKKKKRKEWMLFKRALQDSINVKIFNRDIMCPYPGSRNVDS